MSDRESNGKQRKRVLKGLGRYDEKNKLNNFMIPIVKPLTPQEQKRYDELMALIARYKCPYCNKQYHGVQREGDGNRLVFSCGRCMYQDRTDDKYIVDIVIELDTMNERMFGAVSEGVRYVMTKDNIVYQIGSDM